MTDEKDKDHRDKQEGNGQLSVGSLVAPYDGLLQPVGLPSDLSVDGPVQDGEEQDDQGVENYCSRRSHLKVLLLSREDFCEGNFSKIFLYNLAKFLSKENKYKQRSCRLKMVRSTF